MNRWKITQRLALLALCMAALPQRASAQSSETLSVSGTFGMDAIAGTVGQDLAQVHQRGSDHWWRLTLHGVSYRHDYYHDDFEFDETVDTYITRVHATSFELRFFGPDEDIFNEVLSRQLTRGGLDFDAVLELQHDYYVGPNAPQGLLYPAWHLALYPTGSGVSFTGGTWWQDPPFSIDENGFPILEPQRVQSSEIWIADHRPGNSGALRSNLDVVDFGSADAPFPLPTLPSLTILDASAPEGDRGTNSLSLTVQLSQSSARSISVNFRTADGTALAKQDYTATSGTLTLEPGQTSRTISIGIKADRKREPNETFTVQLSNAVGATIADGTATATIVNDD